MDRLQPGHVRGRAWSRSLAATLLVLTAGCNSVAPSAAVPTGRVTEAVAPTAGAPSPTTHPTSIGSADQRLLAAGTYQVGDPFGIPTTVTLPAGWTLDHVDAGDVYLSSADAWIVIDILTNVFDDPCHSASGPIRPPVAPTVDAVVAALTGMAGFTAGPVLDIAVGERAGKAFDLGNGIRTQSADCYQIERLPMWTNRAGTEQWTIGGSHERLWVVDVDGTGSTRWLHRSGSDHRSHGQPRRPRPRAPVVA